jgi:hypothetical protein
MDGFLPKEGEGVKVHAQNVGPIRNRVVDVPAAGNAGVLMNPNPHSSAFLMTAFIPSTGEDMVVGPVDVNQPGDPDPKVYWVQTKGTRDPMDASPIAMGKYYVVSTGAGFKLFVTDIG